MREPGQNGSAINFIITDQLTEQLYCYYMAIQTMN